MKKILSALSLVLTALAVSSLIHIGSALNNVQKIVEEVSPPPPPEPTLQDWFIANGYAIDVTADETGIEIFEAGYYRMSILAEFALYAPLNNVSFCFYVGSGGQLSSVFQGENAANESVYFWAEGDFGLCLGSPEGYFYTEALRNGDGKDHALVFDNPCADGYLVAWEDLWDLGDADYQDIVLAALAPVEVDVRYCPKTLNLKSHGRWITAVIVLPCEFTADDVDLSSIMLNGTIPADAKHRCRCNRKDWHVLIVKFDRQAVIQLIKESLAGTGCRAKRTEISLTVTGRFTDGTPFQGTSKIRVIQFNCHAD